MKRIRYVQLSLLLLAVLFIGTADRASAQRSHTEGLFLNLHLNGAGIGYADDEFGSQSGGGLGGQIGYGVSRLVTIYLGVDFSAMSSENVENIFGLAHADLGVHLNFGDARSAARPYVNLAFNGRAAAFDLDDSAGSEVELSGGGATLGGGLKYFLSRAVALDVGAAFTFGTFTDVTVGSVSASNAIDIDATSGRFMVGLSFYPTR